jgi:hypothetical protein
VVAAHHLEADKEGCYDVLHLPESLLVWGAAVHARSGMIMHAVFTQRHCSVEHTSGAHKPEAPGCCLRSSISESLLSSTASARGALVSSFLFSRYLLVSNNDVFEFQHSVSSIDEFTLVLYIDAARIGGEASFDFLFSLTLFVFSDRVVNTRLG